MDGKKQAFNVFKNVRKHVRGYRAFLADAGIVPSKINALRDFEKIPISDKATYLKKYPFPDLLIDGKIPPMVSLSSGSSGKPFYWPRTDADERAGGIFHEKILRDIFKLKGKRVLAVVCFSMGNWIAGTFTQASLRHVARSRGFEHLSIVTPGIDRDDILQILEDFAPSFDAVILFGYPPFLMDVVFGARERHVPLKDLNLYFILAGENFSEKWRSLLLRQAGVRTDEIRSVSIYGTADAGAIGHETPFTIKLRELAQKNPSFKKALYGMTEFIPTTISYYPERTYFEMVNGELIFTANVGLPLVRYNIKDHGLLYTREDVIAFLQVYGLYDETMQKLAATWKNPTVILKGRNDVSVTFYALNIYPENLRAGLEDDKVEGLVTGKYVVSVEHTPDLRDQELKLAIELAPGIKESKELEQLVSHSIFENLLKLNTEYRKLYNSIHEKALPQIKLISYGHEQFAVKKHKHRWIKKN